MGLFQWVGHEASVHHGSVNLAGVLVSVRPLATHSGLLVVKNKSLRHSHQVLAHWLIMIQHYWVTHQLFSPAIGSIARAHTDLIITSLTCDLRMQKSVVLCPVILCPCFFHTVYTELIKVQQSLLQSNLGQQCSYQQVRGTLPFDKDRLHTFSGIFTQDYPMTKCQAIKEDIHVIL